MIILHDLLIAFKSNKITVPHYIKRSLSTEKSGEKNGAGAAIKRGSNDIEHTTHKQHTLHSAHIVL